MIRQIHTLSKSYQPTIQGLLNVHEYVTVKERWLRLTPPPVRAESPSGRNGRLGGAGEGLILDLEMLRSAHTAPKRHLRRTSPQRMAAGAGVWCVPRSGRGQTAFGSMT